MKITRERRAMADERIKAAIRAWKTAQIRAEEAAKAGETGRAVSAEMDTAAAAWRGVENAVRSQALAAISLEEFKKVVGNEYALNALIGRKMAAVVGKPDLPNCWQDIDIFAVNVLRQYAADATADDDEGEP